MKNRTILDQYVPVDGWFDLSRLSLPRQKFKAYAELQKLGQAYQRRYDYHRQHNSVQLQQLKELCAEMNLDLILHYGALDHE